MSKLTLRIRWRTLIVLSFFSYDLLYSAFSTITGNTTVATALCEGLLILLIILAVAQDRATVKPDAILVIIVSALIFGLTLLIHPEYSSAMFSEDSWNIFNIVFIIHGGVFSYLYFRVEDEPEELINDLKISAWPVWICYTLKTAGGVSFESVSAISGNTILRTYNQAYGYAFLMVAIIFTYVFLKEKKKIYGVFTCIVLVQILLYASRTAILSYGLYIVLYLLVENIQKDKLSKKILYCIVLAVALLVLTSDSFINWLSLICQRVGISSKIIDSFISGGNELDGGRITLWTEGIQMIKENPLGLGAYSDNYNLGVYVHNIFIQLLMTFGWFIGGAIVFLLIRMIVKMFAAPENTWKSLFLMFFSMTVIRLLLSYSFWYDQNFWFMIATYVGYTRSCRRLENDV